MQMTLREVDWRLRAISKRTTRDMEMQATLHGMKIKSSESSSNNSEAISDDAKKVFDKMLEGGGHGQGSQGKGWSRF